MAVLVPSHAIRRVPARLGRLLYDRLVANKSEAAGLAAVRGTLLPMLISVELRLHEASRLVEALA